jgi:TolB protein
LAWSPDSKWIAFNATFKIGNSQQIFVLSVENGELKQVTSDSHAKFNLSWSPDGESLIYVEEGDPTDLVVTRVDGTFIKKITFTPGYETYPTWSPDGNNIAFLYREARFLEHSELWVMDHDGKNRQKVTNHPISFNTISWSPDGEEILFVSYDDCGKLYSVSLSGNNLREILNFSGCIEDPSWSPDGRYIMFIGSNSKTDSLSSPSWRIHVMFSDGSGISQLATNPGGRPIISIWDSSTK